MHDAPHPEAILGAVAAFLRAEVMPALALDLSFKTRIAANALDLVRRQLTEDPARQAALQSQLAELLQAFSVAEISNATLARLIRENAMLPAAMEDYLGSLALAKLAVDQPGYAGGRDAGRLGNTRTNGEE